MKTIKAIVVLVSAVGILMMAAAATPATVSKTTKCRYAKVKAATKLIHDFGKCRKKAAFADDNFKVFDEFACEDSAQVKCQEAFDRADQTYGIECNATGDGATICNNAIEGYINIEGQI